MTKAYCIKDTNGNYGGHLNIFSNAENGRADYKWSYYSTQYPFSWFECECDNCDKINLELQNEISRLREINLLSGFDLDWMVEEFYSREDVVESFVRGRDSGFGSRDSFVVVKDIKRGCIGLHRRMIRDIRKKYKGMSMVSEISDEYIDQIVELV